MVFLNKIIEVEQSKFLTRIKDSFSRKNGFEKKVINIINDSQDIVLLYKNFELLEADPLFFGQAQYNKLRADALAKASLLASGVKKSQLPQYLEKLDHLWNGFRVYIETKRKRTDLLLLGYLKEYLWKGGPGRGAYDIFKFDEVIDNQLSYFSNPGQKIPVGNCVGLTTLFNYLAVREGLLMKAILFNDHIMSKHENSRIENTDFEKEYQAAGPYYIETSAIGVVAGILSWRATTDYINKARYRLAIAVLKKAIALTPRQAILYCNVGYCYYMKGRKRKAALYYKKAIELDPSFARGYGELGNIYFDLKNYHEASRFYQQAIELQPEEKEFYYNLTEVYRKLGDDELVRITRQKVNSLGSRQ